MIGRLRGTVVKNESNPATVMVGGVGYQVYLPPSEYEKLQNDTEIDLRIHTQVTDDAITLYGFSDSDSLAVFTLLLTVSGIGPKTALLVVDRGAGAVRDAVTKSDLGFFTSVPRLGKKNAQKIIIELASKITGSPYPGQLPQGDGEAGVLVQALKEMGFTDREIRDALPKIPEADNTTEKKMKSLLRVLSKTG